MRKSALISLLLVLAAGVLFAQTANNSTDHPAKAKSSVPQVASLPPAAEQAMAAVDPEKIRAWAA